MESKFKAKVIGKKSNKHLFGWLGESFYLIFEWDDEGIGSGIFEDKVEEHAWYKATEGERWTFTMYTYDPTVGWWHSQLLACRYWASQLGHRLVRRDEYE